MNLNYVGIELRKEQVDSNISQATKICKSYHPKWIIGDSHEIDTLCKNEQLFDFMFTCPPYFNLEIYSNLNGDISNFKEYSQFLKSYNKIIEKSFKLLKEHS